MASGNFKSGGPLRREDRVLRINALKAYRATLAPKWQRALDTKISGFEAAMKEHVTAETNRAIEAMTGNHKGVMDKAGDIQKSVESMEQTMTDKHEEAMTAAGDMQKSVGSIEQKMSDNHVETMTAAGEVKSECSDIKELLGKATEMIEKAYG